MAGDQVACCHHVGLEIRRLDVAAAVALQGSLDEKGHYLRQLRGLFLTVNESGDRKPFDQRLAVLAGCLAECAGRTAYRHHWLAGGIHVVNEADRRRVLSRIPQGAVAARVKHRVEGIAVNFCQLDGAGQLPLGVGVPFEAAGVVRLCIFCIAFRAQRRLAFQGRCKRDACARILENILGRSKLLQPEAGLLASVAELIMEGKKHQYVHGGGALGSEVNE